LAKILHRLSLVTRKSQKLESVNQSLSVAHDCSDRQGLALFWHSELERDYFPRQKVIRQYCTQTSFANVTATPPKFDISIVT